MNRMRRALCALSVAGVALGGLVIGVAPAQAAHVQSLNTTPGTEGTARLVFRLPASATVPPGEHPLRLRATSGASGASTVASGFFECVVEMDLPFLVPDEPRFLLPEGDLPGS